MSDPWNTPAMRQFRAFKEQCPGCVLFFRMGDFYELFGDDAVQVSKALGLTLTRRQSDLPMCGVPHHQRDVYLRRALEAGFRVAVVDQIQDPKEARGVVERAVTQVVTPGTLVDESMLDEATSNVLAAVCFVGRNEAGDDHAGIALVELSTGDCRLADAGGDALIDELGRSGVREILYAATDDGKVPPRVARLADALGLHPVGRPSWHFREDEALEAIREQYGVRSVSGFGLSDGDCALPALGAAIRYLRETQAVDREPAGGDGQGVASGSEFQTRRATLAHLAAPRRESPAGVCRIDATSLRALEVERTIRSDAPEGSLLGVFLCARAGPRCVFRTAMGKRLVRDWLCRPLADAAAIRARQDAVATLLSDRRAGDELRAALADVQDVARIAGRIALGRATPRDLVALGRSLGTIDALLAATDNAPALASQRRVLEDAREHLAPLAARIAERCVDDPPAHLREGGLIRDGVDPELDEARLLQRDAGQWLADYQARLVAEHDLPSLKVGFNKVFGYYIELPAAQARRAPDAFSRKQTLKNAERYITPELKQFEDKVTTAEARALERERRLFDALCEEAARVVPHAARFAAAVAELDVLQGFAEKARHRGWTRPDVVDESALHIHGGRHPVLDELLGSNFVPNDIELGPHPGELALRESPEPQNSGTAGRSAETGHKARSDPSSADLGSAAPARTAAAPTLALITGPNMGGKSTFIRQTALLTLLAMCGSFIPADRATIGVADRIFTRVGADDALHRGQSTFMVEMTETAAILNNATGRSLVILDEIGRGTSTLDGLSLAWAIAEGLTEERHSDAPPRTLFATHYHELTELAERMPGRVVNLHVQVREWTNADGHQEIVFQHTIAPGRADRSYGVHVARLAGIPTAVTRRAEEILESLSVHSAHAPQVRPEPERVPARSAKKNDQLGLFTEYVEHPAVAELRRLNIESLSPLQAFEELRRLVEAARRA